MENLYNAIDEVVLCIKKSPEYINCINLKEQMSNNKEISELIEKIKVLQKKYIKSNYDKKIKEELDKLEENLNNIPIYNIYNKNLEVVNDKINYVKDCLNDYFYKLFNEGMI